MHTRTMGEISKQEKKNILEREVEGSYPSPPPKNFGNMCGIFLETWDLYQT